MEIQRTLGSDIAMVFRRMSAARRAREGAAPGRRAHDPLGAGMSRTTARRRARLVFGIVQGGSNAALREECAKALVAMDFDGYAIGGVSVGEPEPEMMKAVELTEPFLPAHKARYAMGLGTPAQMVELIARGVDMFDCVLPTRVARNGTAYTRKGAIGIKGGSLQGGLRAD